MITSFLALLGLLGAVISFCDDADEERQCSGNRARNLEEDDSHICADRSLDDYLSFSCSLYMAESTIPGAGLGIFSGIDRQEGNIVGNGDVMFPIVDLSYHLQGLRRKIAETILVDDVDPYLLDPMHDYIWFGPEMGMEQETSHPFIETEYVSAFAPGLDAAINCHLALTNTDKRGPTYDAAGLHRSKDPGAGSFTPYHRGQTYVTHPIPAGGELFKYYGDGWFTTREEQFGLVPLPTHYTIAERLLHKFNKKIERRKDWSESVRMDLFRLMTNFSWPSRTINALPKDRAGFVTVIEEGIRAIHQPNATRAVSDLNEHGRCLDYTAPRPSTIRQAGRGAFSTRFLPAGTTVASSPLLFFPFVDLFEMYAGSWMTKDDVPDGSRIVHHQILYNYCWHHPESSIFLCPYGAGINYINHGSNKTGAANVRLQWAKDGEMGHKSDWLTKSPKAMLNLASPGLFLDVVATRDIQPDEEILYDYGELWEAAWVQHVADWGAKHRHSETYQSARDWSEANPDAVLLSEKEQEEHPYPSHFVLKCLPHLDEYKYTNEEAREKWGEFLTPGNPCRIINRTKMENDDQFYYKILYKEMELMDLEEQKLTSLDEQPWIELDGVVRGALTFVDAPYSTDMWLQNAFRHPIGFPDDIFPDAWRGEFISVNDLIESSF